VVAGRLVKPVIFENVEVVLRRVAVLVVSDCTVLVVVVPVCVADVILLVTEVVE
jgi:hypothetical protein